MSNINVWAIVLAAVVQMLIGAVWYSPLLFAQPWMKAVGKKVSDLRQTDEMGLSYGFMSLAALVEAYVLAEIIKFVGVTNALQGGELGFLLGAGIVATAVAGDYVFLMRGKNLYLINLTYNVVGLIAMGMVLGAWR